MTSATSTMNNESSGAEMPNPPISVSPKSRRNRSFDQAVGANRSVGFRICGVCGQTVFFIMAKHAPFIVVEALRANGNTAIKATAQAVSAEYLLASFAIGDTVRAVAALAGTTFTIAIATQRSVASFAGCRVLGVDIRSAIAADLPIPNGKLNIGAVAVIGSENAGYQRKEIHQSALR